MAIIHRIKPLYASKNDEIVANLRDAAGAGPPIDPHMRIKKLVAETAYLMALIHGGEWRIDVDHEVGSVVVRRR